MKQSRLFPDLVSIAWLFGGFNRRTVTATKLFGGTRLSAVMFAAHVLNIRTYIVVWRGGEMLQV